MIMLLKAIMYNSKRKYMDKLKVVYDCCMFHAQSLSCV